jgi:hypothetical protein
MDEGMQIDRSDEQPANADSPSVESLEPDPNVNTERRTQGEKHDRDIVSIDEGRQIDRSDEHF